MARRTRAIVPMSWKEIRPATITWSIGDPSTLAARKAPAANRYVWIRSGRPSDIVSVITRPLMALRRRLVSLISSPIRPVCRCIAFKGLNPASTSFSSTTRPRMARCRSRPARCAARVKVRRDRPISTPMLIATSAIFQPMNSARPQKIAVRID